ncbi:MAG: hypothetical protein J6V92_06165 [Bacteroidaceae bacterium]|nr:hypothetical protein [Bacteroidaceae bacterium]
MRQFFYILLSLMIYSCSDSNFIGDIIDTDSPVETDTNHYVIYQNDKLSNYTSAQIIMFLEDIDDKDNNISKNENVAIEDSLIKINLYHTTGTFIRYLHVLVLPEIDIEIQDTITI